MTRYHSWNPIEMVWTGRLDIFWFTRRSLWNVFIKQQFTVLPRTKSQRGNESHNWRPATLKIKSRYHYTIFLYFLAIVGGWCQYTACILLAAWNIYLIVVTWEGSLYDIVSIANQLNWTDNHRPHSMLQSDGIFITDNR